MLKLHCSESFFRGRTAEVLLRVLMGFVVFAIVVHVALARFSGRRRLDLMFNTRCVPMKTNHLDVNYARDDACFSRRQIQNIINGIVLDVSVAFDANNLTYFLDSGTLLGSYRDGLLIPHDQDADMGIDERSFMFIQKNPIALPSKYALHVFGSDIHAGGYRDKELPVRIVHKESALYMDVFVFVDSHNAVTGRNKTGPIPSACFNNCHSCPELEPGIWQFQVPYDWIYPLQNCSFDGRTLKCPAQSEKYLRYMYGDDFKTPAYEYYGFERTLSPP